MSTPRYPLADLEQVLAARPRHGRDWDGTLSLGQTLLILARRLGGDRRRVRRWQETGLSERDADAVACALGLHPAVVWPQWAAQADHPGGACRCGSERVPSGRVCDRCGRWLPRARPALRPPLKETCAA